MKTWRVSGQESGMRLAAFIKSRLKDALSAKKIKQGIENNLCLVNDTVERFASTRVKTGDAIRFDARGMEKLPPKVYELESERVLFEDDAVIVYDKPSGVASDETGLAALFDRYFLVHRLDKETTGAIVFAKTQEVREKMDDLFRTRKVGKVYLALVDGIVKEPSGVIENAIARLSKGNNPILWGVVSPKKGKFAKTRWELARQGPQAALMRCFPLTGRTHQIRVHMKELGHPILGDYRYGANYRCTYHAKRCMLHASELRFPHPLTGVEVEVEAPLAQDFNEAMRKVLL